MNSYWKITTLTPRAQDQQWINILHATHDQYCSCTNTIGHLLQAINQQTSPTHLSQKEIEKIKCHLTGETTTGTEEDDETGFGPGDLEKLFSEDTDVGEDADG